MTLPPVLGDGLSFSLAAAGQRPVSAIDAQGGRLAACTRLMKSLGLSELEERVYRAVLAVPEITRGELVDSLDRASRQVVDAIGRLEDLGLVGRVEGRPRRFVPMHPDVALESLLHARQQELLQTRTAVTEFVAQYHASRRDNPGELVEVLTGERAVARRFAELQASCREEFLLFDRPPYAAPPDNPQQVSVLRRGVRWRTVYAPESLQHPNALEHIARLAAAGEEARMLPGLPMKLAVADRRVALLPLTLGSALSQTAVIHRSTLLDAMVTLFDLFWQRAVPVGPAVRATHGDVAGVVDLPEEDRRILALLVTGAKDEAIARELGIGIRTLRRRMRHLMDALDAETRFQAGIQATRRGLV